ncbi:P-loop containing nucleoside triphosphate hydrolase protein [Vararia minispora EC-137]|uniref:P-loop containing nucleoside triphosphate hydrolase protein n=1 Tax=Vararia minispora EC-137 TaxID=1314806 RepID=A0ACB8QHR5_9AGAM|nr:P-loop containing nucleoside triphosphate hydrolase protein [Vararia minispora EC-137]
MGPSGAGKSTILDIISMRTMPTSGTVSLSGSGGADLKSLTSYVEQSDALLGVLTVEESLYFAARLSLDPATPQNIVKARVHQTMKDLGLTEVAKNRIGTPIQRGVSGGQKRRVTIGTSLVTVPRILILDEPTSGLDSRTSKEVLSAIKNFAYAHGVIVIASIHQPNWETFALFDKLLLLAQGRQVYFGPINRLATYLDVGLSRPVPFHANPSDHALDAVNTDFMPNSAEAEAHVERLATTWKAYAIAHTSIHDVSNAPKNVLVERRTLKRAALVHSLRVLLSRTWYLMVRNWINYSRNLLAYGVRLGMYFGIGILLATIWTKLPADSSHLQERITVHFFAVAFLGFMSVAGIPAYLEERQVFIRERSNGLYGAGPFVLANTIVVLPYLFVCVLAVCLICYWSIGLHPGAGPFFRFTGILFLAVYTAEAQSALVAALCPIFVAALAITSFINGLWMCVGGYFVSANELPKFWYYWAHFIGFQTYSFDLLAYGDLKGLIFACQMLADGSCFCNFPSSLTPEQCAITGEDVLRSIGIDSINYTLYAFILFSIAVVYRFALYVVLALKKR